MISVFLLPTISLAENSSGGWTSVEAFYTYMGNGAYCGESWVGGTLIALTLGGSAYAAPCEADKAFLDIEAVGGDAALATLLSAYATGKQVKVNVTTDNPIVCETNGKHIAELFR